METDQTASDLPTKSVIKAVKYFRLFSLRREDERTSEA